MMSLEAIGYAIIFALIILMTLVGIAIVKGTRWAKAVVTQMQTLKPAMRHLAEENTAEVINALSLAPLNFHFPVVLGGPSIDAHHARLLLHLLQERRPRRILELGSGSSTILIAKILLALKIPADLHIAVDHETKFLSITRENAELNGVASLIRLECCPLAHVAGFAHPWYSGVPDLLGSSQLDFVVVDGPPAYEEGHGLAREPALDVLRPFLARNATVLLDDANRTGEREVVKRWQQRYPDFEVFWMRHGKGVAVLTGK